MAELVTSVVVGPLLSMVKQKASNYLLEQYKVMDGMEDQLGILERKLPAILGVIEDAEEKGPYQPRVGPWLDALKKVAYEANDVFDEFKYEVLRREAKKKGHYSKLGMDVVNLFPAHNSIVFRYRMGKKLRRIVQTIEVLAAEMNTFGFIHRQQAPPSNDWRKTDPIMLESEEDIVKRSRHEEKEKIVRILLDQACDSDLRVLPIVGMGGLGKTTFAQLIYNDPEIEKHFELQWWCCVSDDFDVGNIANGICKTTEKDREKALRDLQKEVSGKRYLIVLDDVWNRDADKWGKLTTCLKQGGKGSAILTTTRDAEVARVMSMGIVEAHNLEKLADEYLKEMIQSRAFSLPSSDELDGIVDNIVDRCAGCPLAAKAFGSMLSNKISMQEWKDLLARANIEKTGILPILKLSYDDLPPHMKQCFAFCAVFPKDYEIDVETLIRLWMAHDFIPLQEEVHLETIGGEIFKELAWRSFFQDVKQTPLEYEQRKQLCNRTICKMHDLMHDIALSVMGKECLTITERPNHKTLWLNSTRHLFSSYREIGTHLDDFLKKQSPSLRTLLYPIWYTDGSAPHLSKYNSLRALQLFRSRALPVRPKHLQHLRYLSLSDNRMIKELPEEISLLYNLQTLDLSGCWNLDRLPKDMKYMTSLRHVYTNGCKSLKCMPPDLGHLTSLQTLTYFVVGASSGCSTVRELRNLNLGGELELCCLENVTEAQAKAASLINKEKLTHLSLEWSDHSRAELTHLSLEWSDHSRAEPVSDCHKKVLDALRPHNGLLMLRIKSYKSTSLPIWTTDLGVLQKLTELHLVGCTTCEEFPRFSHLKALQVLYLFRLDKMQSLCSDAACTAFPALKELRLHDLERLEKWVATEGTTQEELTFPLLEKFDIDNCPKLTTLPEAPKLKVVQLKEEKAQLSLSIVSSRYMSTLSRLVLTVRDREATPTLQLDENHEASVTEMTLYGCNFFFPSSPSQPTIGILKWFRQLVHLRIVSCDALIYWPEEEFRCLVSLKNLVIRHCSKLIGPTQTQVKGDPTRARDQLLPHLTSLDIYGCERLTELFILPPSLTHISIGLCRNVLFKWGKEDTESESVQVEHLDTFASSEHCNDLSSTSMPEQLPSPRNNSLPPSLERLSIESCDKLVTLSYLPPSLKSLLIYSCDKLRSVSGQLDALEYLHIVLCNTLESLECLGDLPSLQTLHLYSCDKLHSVSGQMDALEWLRIDGCNTLESLECLGDLPSLQTLHLYRCKRLASLPAGLGSSAGLRWITIQYCPDLNIKPLYESLEQRLDGLEHKDLSHARSSYPGEGPKLRDPKSWKYVIPQFRDY